MKALYFEKTGSLDYLQIKELARPALKDGEALIEVRAAAINPSDPKNVLGKMSITTLPRVPGRDFSGVVIDGPKAFQGKSVFGTGGDLGFRRDGSHAELLAVPTKALIEKPEYLSFEEAAALGLAYLTAWNAIVDAGGLSSSDTVLITGASGAVGSSAIKIAKSLGVKNVIGLIRDEEAKNKTNGIPADQWITLKDAKWPEVDLILDVIGGELFARLNQSLAAKGRHIVIASNPAEVQFNLLDFYHRQAHLIGIDTLKLSFSESAQILSKILPLLKKGVLLPPQIKTIELKDAIDAYKEVANGKAKTKLVIKMPSNN